VRRGGALGLRRQADAAVDGGDGEALGGGERGELLGHLGRELARGDQDERRRGAVLGERPLDERQPERQGLSRPGGRLGEHVVAGEGVGDDQRLNLEGLGDAALGERLDHGRADAEIREGLGHFCSPWQAWVRDDDSTACEGKRRCISRPDPVPNLMAA